MSSPLPEAIAVPVSFFTEVLPAVRDLAELRVTLAMYHRQAAGPPLVAEGELLADPTLRRGLLPLGSARDPADELLRALEQALTRGTLLAVRPVDPGDRRRWYTLNTPAGRELVEELEAGRRPLTAVAGTLTAPLMAEPATVFRLYERHIAVLSPLVAQQLADAAAEFPTEWIVEAFAEAVARERRSWRFIRHLLERWASEGREHGTHRGHTGRSPDPSKYTKGKYAAIFQR